MATISRDDATIGISMVLGTWSLVLVIASLYVWRLLRVVRGLKKAEENLHQAMERLFAAEKKLVVELEEEKKAYEGLRVTEEKLVAAIDRQKAHLEREYANVEAIRKNLEAERALVDKLRIEYQAAKAERS